MKLRFALCLATSLGLAACDDDDAVVDPTIFGELGGPVGYASPAQQRSFERGRAVALRRFAPDDGLGPQFNVTFCSACHEKPVFGGAGGRYRNFLLVGQRLPDESFVPTGVNGVQSQFRLAANVRVATDPATNTMAQRNPIPFFGAGLLAEIPEREILRRADPDDRDGDGISGRPNFERGFLGRFGRKSQSAAVEAFIRGPLFNHLGVTSNPLSPELRARLPVPSIEDGAEPATSRADLGVAVKHQVGAPDEPNFDDDASPDPELREDELFDLVSFAMLLAPLPPDEPTPETAAGGELFDEIGCADCHVPALRGPRGLVPAYTDLLVHDMGDELADGIPMGDATGAEFRTAPLWGIAVVAPYLHDGRADTLDEAIRFHGGEADASRDAYEALTEAERAGVLAFLRSLGGQAERSEGLLPPDAPIPVVGDYGGPTAALGAADRERFRRGRAVFDRDMAINQGLGPRFNGDACRACHFDPVIGGAGPADVDVVRHGVVDPDSGTFTPPAIGTMAHRHTTAMNGRPPTDPDANVFEARQTPTALGLGLIDRIPEASIIALADPDDLDDDGISGRAHVLPDGRLGRFGWKANVPSVAEFARDALFNELGVTLPDQPGLSFGAGEDDDDASDPEISEASLDDLVFYLSSLAPPPRTSTAPALEALGEEVFDAIGCATCHVPALDTADGDAVPLFSDLLLHDVAPAWAVGIADGDATMREFRTPPLWGLASSAPYMHDGAAYTVDEAILLHAGEGHASRDAFLDLPPTERDALLRFLESL